MYGRRMLIAAPSIQYDPVASAGLQRFIPKSLVDAYNRVKGFYRTNQSWLDPVMSHGLAMARLLAAKNPTLPDEEEQFNVA